MNTIIGKLIFKENGPVQCGGMNWSNDFTAKELKAVSNYPGQDFSQPHPMWPMGWRPCEKSAVVSEVLRGDGEFKMQIVGWCDDHKDV